MAIHKISEVKPSPSRCRSKVNLLLLEIQTGDNQIRTLPADINLPRSNSLLSTTNVTGSIPTGISVAKLHTEYLYLIGNDLRGNQD